jgi:hypothetical protein
MIRLVPVPLTILVIVGALAVHAEASVAPRCHGGQCLSLTVDHVPTIKIDTPAQAPIEITTPATDEKAISPIPDPGSRKRRGAPRRLFARR